MKMMLLVEDDDLSVMVMKKIFQDNYEISDCESAEEYYEKYSDKNFNIIIMDISLKGSKNGLELMKEIKAVPSYTGTPIICLTAHAQPNMMRTAIECGSDLVVTKPVSNKKLREAVELLLKSKQTNIKAKM